MADLIAHPWVQGPCATREQIIEEFQKREKQVKDEEEKERNANKEAKAITPRENDTRRTFRHGDKEYFTSGELTFLE